MEDLYITDMGTNDIYAIRYSGDMTFLSLRTWLSRKVGCYPKGIQFLGNIKNVSDYKTLDECFITNNTNLRFIVIPPRILPGSTYHKQEAL
jgi:hypothetical protein